MAWPTDAEFQNGENILDPAATKNFTYSITAGGGSDPTGPFQVTATGRDKMSGVTVIIYLDTINDNGDITVITDATP